METRTQKKSAYQKPTQTVYELTTAPLLNAVSGGETGIGYGGIDEYGVYEGD